jgi:hypothetical protein
VAGYGHLVITMSCIPVVCRFSIVSFFSCAIRKLLYPHFFPLILPSVHLYLFQEFEHIIFEHSMTGVSFLISF